MKDFDLKSALFVRAMEALTAYQASINTKYPSPEAERKITKTKENAT